MIGAAATAPTWLALGWSAAVAWLAAAALVRIAGPARHPLGERGASPHQPLDERGASPHHPVDEHHASPHPSLDERAGSGDADTTGGRRRSPPPLLVGVILGALGLVVLGVSATLLAAALLLLHRWSRAALRRRREQRLVEAAIPGMIELLVLTVRAGMTIHQSVRVLATTAPDAVRPGFAAVVHRLDRGTPLADALAALPDTLGAGSVAVVDTLGPADRYGLPLAPALEQLAREARAGRRRLDEADARRLPVRLSLPLVTCTLPAFVLLAIVPALLAAISSLGGHAW